MKAVHMDIGVMLPYVVSTSREPLLRWCRAIEDGPFQSLAIGDRLNYGNLDQLVALSVAAAVTENVRILTHVMVLPMYSTAVVAKRAATIDVVSAGRLTMAVGVGWRPDDFRAAGQPFRGRFQRLDDQVRELRRL